MNLVIVLAVVSIIIIAFVYSIGKLHGIQRQKVKQNEERLNNILRACSARTNADVDKLRKKYRRSV